MNKWLHLFLAIVLLSCTEKPAPRWPDIHRETRPWTRWWWHGSALTKEGITAELEAYQRAGIGGVEITPIYGVRGYEDRFVPYLSDKWMELLTFTLTEAERLDMGVDMATGTGWPFGGPWVTDEFACRNVFHTIYSVNGGESLKEKIVFKQSPYLRAVGNQIYEVQDATETNTNKGSRKEPLMLLDPKSISIQDIRQPVESNPNLQQLALDQVQFERELPLITLMAYNESGESLDLTSKVRSDGTLDWIAPKGQWKLYALFQGWHGKMVERAGPGGEGNVIDHFSETALKHYLARFDSVFASHDIKSLRAFFNDSYEVDDARGAADWTSGLMEEFRKRRGYDLRGHLPSLFATDSSDKDRRILYDYRRTIGELVQEKFTKPWTDWARLKGALTRNQAHGSPANILDLYSTVDIPEIEGTDPLRIKMATSAANVSGKRLVSSESATWLDEHFQSDLGEIKSAVDLFLVHGVNHIFYHGTSYSPPDEPWPGWLFYAAVHLNPRNSQWNDFDILNNYVARCQSILQTTKPSNDVLLYYPIADPMSTFSPEMIQHFDGIGKQYEGSSFHETALLLKQRRFGFDFISDNQILATRFEKDRFVTSGGSTYKTIVVPYCEYIPLETLEQLVRLIEAGGTVLFSEDIAGSFAGYDARDGKQRVFSELIDQLKNYNGESGKGRVLRGAIDYTALISTPARPQLKFQQEDIRVSVTRRTDEETVYYFIRNGGPAFKDIAKLDAQGKSVIAYDPMTGSIRKLAHKDDPDGTRVRIELAEEQTMFVAVSPDGNESMEGYDYRDPERSPLPFDQSWEITFTNGGPSLPPTVMTDTLGSWTWHGADYSNFSGTAVYKTTFGRPVGNGNGWLLDLGDVRESARVYLNGKEIAALIAPPFRVKIEQPMAQDLNVLEVHISNLMANRVADLDKRGVFWKKFYNINFPARLPENRKDGQFDASKWVPEPSGLLGPVQLLPLREDGQGPADF